MEHAVDIDAATVVLVEGRSDQAAVEALAERFGHDLSVEGIVVVAIGGATNIARYLTAYGTADQGRRVCGMCDVGEERAFRRALARIGSGGDPSRDEMERLGFFVCDLDLEDELIRALGVVAVERVLAEQGELASFRIMQRQPGQRGRPAEQQLRRFIGTRSGRKIRYGRLLVEALDLSCIPRPLDLLLQAMLAG